ncbi:MAG TPA: glucose 1-dehydrogenase [Roseiflexaceae bacterium]|jgi:NAD(P)-dependent dehydrogenase (short-subunit alcohol dehydrogenase family)|nr:glucose 1-dehydrogenase [Roseiflexaceae bacterium]
MQHEEALVRLFSLRGRVALVTGASGGIGSALARALALAGATVALSGRSTEKLTALQQRIEEQGGTALVFPADLAELSAIPALVDGVAAQCGRIDILVNCAGTNQRMPITEMTPDVYDRIMATNLRGIYFLSQAVLPHMVEQGGGKIINIGSLTSTIGLADVSVYGMTKSALAQLTKTMAIEWAPHNIQVNCICPGFIATELTAPLWQSPTRSAWILDRLPIRRPGTPEDFMGIMIYLASSASDYTTGQSIYVDGGFLAGSQW